MTGTVLSATGGGDVVKAGAPNTVVPVNLVGIQTFVSQSITSIAVGDQLEIEVVGTYLNNSGGTVTPVYQFALGAFTIDLTDGTTVATNASNRAVIVFRGMFAIHSAASVSFVGEHDRAVPAAANAASSIAATTFRRTWRTSASDLTGTQTISVGGRSSTTTATQTFYVHSYRVRKQAAL